MLVWLWVHEVNQSATFDAAANALTRTDARGTLVTQGYDALGRTLSATYADARLNVAYHYDEADGSTGCKASYPAGRLSKVASGLATGAYVYQAGTHWLTGIGSASRTYDANGSTTANAFAGSAWGYGYDGRGRLTVAQREGVTVGAYVYNALGQRVAKTAGALQVRFAYDGTGHLLGEYGTSSREYVWMDSVPVGVIDGTSAAFVHADALDTPRAVTNGAGSVVWSWPIVQNPFGEASPTSPSGYVLNLRFPGQYFDAETGLHDNVNRTYDLTTGRYLQSDPLGLRGSINTFAYAGQNPSSTQTPQDCSLVGKSEPSSVTSTDRISRTGSGRHRIRTRRDPAE